MTTKKQLTTRNRILFGLVGLLGATALVVGAMAYSGSASNVVEHADVVNVGSSQLSGSGMLGGSYTQEPTYLTASDDWMAMNSIYEYGDLEVQGTLYADGAMTVVGALSGSSMALSGQLNALESYEAVTANTFVTNTLLAAESGKTFYISTSTDIVLPATSTASGAYYKFVIAGALASDVRILTADYADIIEGSMIVAGAVVDCAAEDTITFVSDGENLGDYVELRSNGTNWFLGSSGGLSSSKITCTTST